MCTKLCGGGGVVHYYAIVCLDSIALLHWHPNQATPNTRHILVSPSNLLIYSLQLQGFLPFPSVKYGGVK